MAPLSKDAVEIANPVGESAVAQFGASAKTTSGHLRADALSLEINVKVHGSRVTEVVRGVTPHTEPFEELTSTMIVFPQGAVLRMSTSVNIGQMLVLTNLKTRQDSICRVVKVRTFSNMQGYVEVEFTHSQPAYWGVAFPADGPATEIKTAAPAPPAIPQAEVKEKPVPDVSWAPAPPPIAPLPKALESETPPSNAKPASPQTPVYVPPARPASSFISIGSQEEVQVSASATLGTKAAPPAEIERGIHVPQISKPGAAIEFPAAPPTVPPPSVTMSEMRGDEPVAAESSAVDAPEWIEEREESSAATAASSEVSRKTFGSFAGGATLSSSHAAPSEPFGSLSASEADGSPAHSGAPRQNWLLMAACAAVALAGVVGGIFYFHKPAATTSNVATSSAPTPVPSNAVQPPVSQVAQSAAPAGNQIAIPTGASGTVNANAPAGNRNSSADTHAPNVAAKPAAPSVSSSMLASLSAHPVSAKRAKSEQADAAPTVDATPGPASSDSGTMPGIMSSTNANIPPPEIKQEGPIKVGGDVKEPQLISSPMPVYPAIGKQSHTQGDVIVKTVIDTNGSVVHMEVISGPIMLRQAALDALRRWKYEPSRLNGEPMQVEMLVTIKFRL